MESDLVELVWRRAQSRCEYCQLPQEFSTLTFEIDHIIAVKHGGRTIAGNLALSFFYCNRHKGTNLAGVDSRSGRIVPLFHPRKQRWHRHFRLARARVVGRTACGRATVSVRAMNVRDRMNLRKEMLIDAAFDADYRSLRQQCRWSGAFVSSFHRHPPRCETNALLVKRMSFS